jgi:hypothetical protein
MRRQPKIDAGLQEIEAWHTWFVQGHTARLKDADLSPADFTNELEKLQQLAAAIVARMKSDYLARRTDGLRTA